MEALETHRKILMDYSNKGPRQLKKKFQSNGNFRSLIDTPPHLEFRMGQKGPKGGKYAADMTPPPPSQKCQFT